MFDLNLMLNLILTLHLYIYAIIILYIFGLIGLLLYHGITHKSIKQPIIITSLILIICVVSTHITHNQYQEFIQKQTNDQLITQRIVLKKPFDKNTDHITYHIYNQKTWHKIKVQQSWETNRKHTYLVTTKRRIIEITNNPLTKHLMHVYNQRNNNNYYALYLGQTK